MRVLTVCMFYESDHGGGIIVARLLRQLLHEKGHHVDVLCLSGGSDPQPGEVYRISQPRFLSRNLFRQFLYFLNNRLFDRWLQLRANRLPFRHQHYDVVHCQDLLGIELGGQLARRFSAQLGVTLHEFLPRRMELTFNSRVMGNLVQATCNFRDRQILPTLKRTTWIAGVSNAVTHSIKSFVQSLSCRVETVYNPFSPRLPQHANSHLSESGPLRLLFVGRASPEKGLDLLLEAFKKTPMNAKLSVLCLQGALSSLLKRASDTDPRVSILSPVPHDRMHEIYSQHDVVCCPSVWDEPFGLVALEARATQKVIIASNTGGLPEILSQYPRSIMVDLRSKSRQEKILDLQVALLAASKTATSLDREAEAKFMDQFSLEVFARNYESLYQLVRH